MLMRPDDTPTPDPVKLDRAFRIASRRLARILMSDGALDLGGGSAPIDGGLISGTPPRRREVRPPTAKEREEADLV
jgi:hypothetical protein